MKRFLILALLLCCLPALAWAAGDDPVVIRVGSYAYPLSQVQKYWDEHAEMTVAAGYSYSAQQIEDYRDSIIDSFVGMGVLENKYAELGLDRMTAEEEALMEQQAQDYMEQLRALYAQEVMAQYEVAYEEAYEYAETFMKLDGVTIESARSAILAATKDMRMLEYVAGDITTVSAEALQHFYEENYVRPSMERYAGNIAAYEAEVLFGGEESYYIPADYRCIRHILLALPQPDPAALEAAQALMAEAELAVEGAQSRLYGRQLLEMDTAEAEAELAQAQAALAQAQEALHALTETLAAQRSAELEAIRSALQEGESFLALAKAYSEDAHMPEEGYMVRADSVLYDPGFVRAAMSLESIGDVSEPVVTSMGVHVLEYAGDAPSGPLPLTDERWSLMMQNAVLNARYEVLEARLAEWMNDYEIFTDAAGLKTPACLLN